MGRLSDLWIAMTTRRANRINAREADRLLAGQLTDAGHAGVAALLSEASAPARPDELCGEAAAIEDYLRVRSATPSVVDRSGLVVSTVELPGRSPWYGPSSGRTIAIRVAIGVALLSAVGTVSVHFGYLPVRMQQVPGAGSSSSPPSSASSPSPSPSRPSSPGNRRVPGSQPSAGAVPKPTRATGPATVATADAATAKALCRTWTDDRQDKAVRDDVAQRLRPLMATFDGPNGIPAFCRKLLDPPRVAAASTRSASTKTAPTAAAPTTATSPGRATAKTTAAGKAIGSSAPGTVTMATKAHKPKIHG